ncbi:HD domain-containing protein [Mycolicibacterium litorale]|uniref:HD domain-containing protein n=1 Tax=Mycolicibacterium litorale TaxID=758802 RepID=A0AAD1INC8_9MYCO|nr:HD domain-containing protein [Mycolicibacterium litorale]MCV7416448.1 phosphohydrolase [Mycolicibacterium litorale]TDY09702.1 metal dependent phosphohydrolase [Mycolicibacterium litorale]BBY17648.1 hypothetical protein MLIT_32400 [Mycolicibacterium litorale]
MTLPQEVRLSEWNLPDTEVCSAAVRLVLDVSLPVIANHTVRSYLFARELAAARGVRDYDDEVVFLTCILHDLGVTALGGGDQRFEVDGADAAVRFLREHDVAEDRARTVWEGIALHTSLGLVHRFGTEQAVSFSGISLDIDGAEKESLPAGFVERVHAAWPRQDLGFAIADLIAGGIAANPLKAPPFTFPAHLHELLNGSSLTFFDVVRNSGWGDEPVDA